MDVAIGGNLERSVDFQEILCHVHLPTKKIEVFVYNF